MKYLICYGMVLVLLGTQAWGEAYDELKVKVTRVGDKVTITFTSKGHCDATVAIEDTKGRIIRFLASGPLVYSPKHDVLISMTSRGRTYLMRYVPE